MPSSHRLSFRSDAASILIRVGLVAAGCAFTGWPPSGGAATAASHAQVASPRPSALPAYGERLGIPATNDAERSFDRLVDRFLVDHLRADPVRATNIGVHNFDARLPRTSRGAIQARVASLRQVLHDLERIPLAQLGRERRFDDRMLSSRLRGMILDLETVRPWEKNPNFYLGIASGGAHALLKRDFAPLEERVKSLNARLAEVPRVFADARVNLANPPRIYVEVAISQGEGLVRFFRDLVPAQVEPLTNPTLRAEFERRNAAALAAARQFVAWMRTDLLLRSNGKFALGPDVYAKKLLYDEMVDTPIDSLLWRGERALRETQERMEAAAAEIEPNSSPQGDAVALSDMRRAQVRAALARLERDAPSAAQLVPSGQSVLGKIRGFLVEHHILTVPEKEDLRVAETPIFQRALSFASMDSPGVLERHATEAYYYVTPPDSSWPAEQQTEHLGFYNPYQLEIVSIHEAYPGHYYQFLSLQKCPSLVRALYGPGSNSEGWAHYCEQMMVEEGYGAGDARYRLAQLNLALQRICRYLVGIRLHTRGMSYEQAVDFFVKEGYMARVNAEREARRGTSDPTYLVYTLGKWAILDLRDEVRRARGPAFRLDQFHDQFLAYGRAPLALIREDLLSHTP